MQPILHNRPLITAEDRAAVDAVLTSGWIAQGPAVAALEASFTRRYSGGGACALSSGTAALFLALKALGADVGSKVAVPTYACSALLNAVYWAGAVPAPVDVLPDTFCLDPLALTHEVNDKAFAIMVHTYGAGADIAAVRRNGRQVIEDCCHSFGDEGICGPMGKDGDAAVFSFYATKVITGGQGGLIWCKDIDVAEKARDFRQFDCRENYVPRFNLQMTDMQAALVNSQISRLQEICTRRQNIARAYAAALPDGLSIQAGVLDEGRMAYRFVVLAPDLRTRQELRRHLELAGVGCTVPIERYELLHRYLKMDHEAFPVAERLADTTLSLPLHVGLSDSQVEHIVGALTKFAI